MLESAHSPVRRNAFSRNALRKGVGAAAVIGAVLAAASCELPEPMGMAPVPADYQERFEAWHADRVQALTHPTGWMRLAGLHWLQQGVQTFGSGPDADVRFPEGKLQPVAGSFRVRADSVWMTAGPSAELTLDGEPVRPGQEVLLFDPVTQDAPMVAGGSLEWLIIQREDLLGVRLYDHENPLADAFEGFERFPMDSAWHLKARLVPHSEPTQFAVTNVLGQTVMVDSPGILEFTTTTGESYSILPMTEGEKMFIVFGDKTNGNATYGSGRYLYVEFPPEGSDMTIIDFNLAYNPPCSYTAFSTCQLPPPSNRLPIPVRAGELAPGPEYR